VKATIRYTTIKAPRHYTAGRVDFVMGTDEPLDDAIVRVSEITHCTPFAERDGPGTTIHLTTDKRINTATPIDELERRIEAAETIPKIE
jgi:hypothetical protein